MEFKILLISQCAVYKRQTWKHVVSMENFIIGLGELTCMAIFGPFDIDEYNLSIIICEIGLLSSPILCSFVDRIISILHGCT